MTALRVLYRVNQRLLPGRVGNIVGFAGLQGASASVNAMLMGVALMSPFVANTLIGWIGSFYENMNPAEF